MSASRPDVIIVGGGVIGCGIAYELSKRGVGVLLFEQGLLGSGASHAAAGMLAPLSDSLEAPPLQQLGARSFRMYPAFLQEVEETSGIHVECISSGIIRTAMTEEEADGLKALHSTASAMRLPLDWMTGTEARELEPRIGPEVIAATFSKDETQLNPIRLVEALRRAAVANGATLSEHSPVGGLVVEDNRVAGVRMAGEVVAAGTVVLAMGSWSALSSRWLCLDVPISPVRGQVLYVNQPGQPLRHTVMHRHLAYAVPKGDGSILIGTTLENVGFDPRVTVDGVSSILSGVQRLLPALAGASINSTQAGLRPCPRDGLPVLGQTPGIQGVIMASGHHRSGILLTPVTAELIARAITEGVETVDFGPFDAARLGSRRE